MKRSICYWALFIILELLIVIGFMLFSTAVESRITYLNIAVCSIMNFCFALSFVCPWKDPMKDDKYLLHFSGMHRLPVYVYGVAAITFMIVCNYFYHITFYVQLAFQSLLLTLILIARFLTFWLTRGARKRYHEYEKERNGVEHMKKAIRMFEEEALRTRNQLELVFNEIERMKASANTVEQSKSVETNCLEDDVVISIYESKHRLIKINSHLQKLSKSLKKSHDFLILRREDK